MSRYNKYADALTKKVLGILSQHNKNITESQQSELNDNMLNTLTNHVVTSGYN